MCKQALVLDAHLAIVRPLCPGGLLVSLPHRPVSRCLLGIWTWQMRLFACRRLTHRSSFRTELRWPSLWCWTVASTICVAFALHCEWPSWMTSGLRPAVPQLSALASRFTLHQFAVQHLLCPLLVFRLFSPVTDSDKLTKAHETKKKSHGEPEVTSADSSELQQWDWQPNPLWHAPDVRDFAPDVQAGATSTGHEPNSPCSISSDSRSSSLGATVSLPPHAAAAGG